jgi:signal transduction histidine kinase
VSNPPDLRRQLAAQHAVTRELIEAEGVDEAFRRVVRELTKQLGWEVGMAWRPSPAGELEPFALWSTRPEDSLERLKLATRFPPGAGLPGRVWQSGRPECMSDLSTEAGFWRADAAAARGLASACALPVRVGPRVVAVLEFFAATRTLADPELLDTLVAIGDQLGLRVRRAEADSVVLEQKQRLEASAAEMQTALEELTRQRAAAEAARAEAESARAEAECAREDLLKGARWASFLAEAGRALASALDREDALRVLAGLAVPAIADLCVIDVLQEHGDMRRLEMVHGGAVPDPPGGEPGGNSQLPRADAPAIAHVIRTGEPRLLPHVGEAELQELAQDELHLTALRALGLQSLMIVPMIARTRTLGAVTLATTGSGRRYDAADLANAEPLLDRAALAIDNAALYEQALAANRAKSNFLAIISHELRTPLTAIMGYTDILSAGIAGTLGPRQAQYLDRVMVSARHLLRLIDEILTFSRLEVGRERTHQVRVPLREFARETANLVRPAMLDRRLEFTIELPPEDAYAETDPEKVRQVLLDLLLNAVKFTPHGRVTFRTHTREGNVYFDVQDTGIGIQRDDIERIFDPFWQAEDAMTRREGGTGIGLSVARRLAHLLGGDIEVRSTPGKGTLFTLRIPQEAPATDVAAA